MNADSFSITSKKIPCALHEGHVDPYKIRYVSILPRIHAPSIYIPSSPTPAWIHGDPRQNNPRSLHGVAWIYIGSYMDPFHVPSVSDPFWHYLPPPVKCTPVHHRCTYSSTPGGRSYDRRPAVTCYASALHRSERFGLYK
uniref:Uncharacterized protein n=1 Tax=Caenorhabditis japonica TaxID=281687 RepID=A0A8R1E565_CAEJA